MSAKLLGKNGPVANTYTTIYSVPAGKKATAVINACNINQLGIKVRIAICPSTYVDGSAPDIADFYEYDVIIGVGSALERSALILDSGEKVVVYSNSANTAFRLHGMEE